MDMVINTPSPQRNTSKDVRDFGCRNCQTQEEESDRKSKILKISKQSILCPEKGFIRGKMGHRSVTPQCLHSVSHIPYADNARSKTSVTQGFLDRITGLEGRFLAHTSFTSEKTLPRVQVQRPVLEIQGDALWAKHRAQNLHKGNGSCDKNLGIRRNICPNLSGRLTNSCSNRTTMRGTQRPCNCTTNRIRMDNKYREISPTTSPNFRLAGSSLRSQSTHSKSHSGHHGHVQKATGFSDQIEFHNKTHTNACSGVGKLDWTNQPNCSYAGSQNQSALEKVQERTSRYTDSTLKRHETQSHQMGIYPHNPSAIGESTTYNHHPNRCLSQRVWISDRPNSIPRRFRPINEELLNKHIGTGDNLVSTDESDQRKPNKPHTVRQFDCSISGPKKYYHGIPFSNDFRANMEKSNKHGMDTYRVTHTRKIQHRSRPIEQEHSSVNRMVSTTRSIQRNHDDESTSSNRPVCDSVEQSTEDLHLSMPRSESGSSGCDGDSMGQMGSSISLSPVNHDFEGFAEVVGVSMLECNTDYTGLSDQTMVHGIETPTDSIDTNECPSAADGSGQTRNSSHSYQTPRLEIIKQAYSRQFPNCPDAVTLMATPIRKSSIAEYQKKWNSFMTYIENQEIPFEEISITTVIKFLTYLFYERHLSPNTVAHYKSALVIPLQAHFNIDLNATALKDLLRAMNLQRPSLPASAPAWSLNKVLTFLEGLTNPIPLEMLLRKTAFLLMLATGWRVSELHACVRDHEYCYFTADSVLHIRPHPSFLAKNESTQRRWDFKEIKPLRLEDESISRLCPAATTKEYLRRTKMVSSGNLFLTPNDHKKTLTIHKLSYHICQFIRLADPVTRIRAHDVRKYASSCSFVNTMLVGDLVSAMNWSSPATFFKFYFTQTEPLCTPVALPVGNQ